MLIDPASAQAPKPSVAIFDGKTLSGWHKPQGVPADYRGGKWDVVDGTLVGDQDPPGMGGLLGTDRIYHDYIIELDVSLDKPADSGVFLRMGEDGKNHQLTLDNDQSKKFGDVYLSWGRGTVHEAPESKKHFRQGAWNTVKIQIQGERPGFSSGSMAWPSPTSSTPPRPRAACRRKVGSVFRFTPGRTGAAARCATVTSA